MRNALSDFSSVGRQPLRTSPVTVPRQQCYARSCSLFFFEAEKRARSTIKVRLEDILPMRRAPSWYQEERKRVQNFRYIAGSENSCKFIVVRTRQNHDSSDVHAAREQTGVLHSSIGKTVCPLSQWLSGSRGDHVPHHLHHSERTTFPTCGTRRKGAHTLVARDSPAPAMTTLGIHSRISKTACCEPSYPAQC